MPFSCARGLALAAALPLALALGACNAFDDPGFDDDPPPPRTFAPPVGVVVGRPAMPAPSTGSTTGPTTEPFVGVTPPFAPPVIQPPPPMDPTAGPCNGLGFDNDSLDEDDEQDAGLDACRSDSDDDGCPDVFEFHAGGCDDRGAVLLGKGCFFFPPPVDVEYRVPDGGPFDEVRLLLPTTLDDTHGTTSALRFSSAPVRASPSDAATLDRDRFIGVQGGALLVFQVTLEEVITSLPDGSAVVGELQLLGDGEQLSTHPVVVATEGPCEQILVI